MGRLHDDFMVTLAGRFVSNLLVFAALGFCAPLRFAALASVPRILALAAGCSVLAETAQYILRLNRVSSVDDVLLKPRAPDWQRWWRAAGGALQPQFTSSLQATIAWARSSATL